MPLCPGGRCAAGCDKNRGTVLWVYRLRSLSRHRTLKSRPIELSSTAVCSLKEHRVQQNATASDLVFPTAGHDRERGEPRLPVFQVPNTNALDYRG